MIGRQPSARHNTVNVRMRLQSLSPGVQDAEKADLGTEMLWVRGNFQQTGSSGIEQESEQCLLVLPDQRGEQVRNAEDEMKIVHRQQFLLALRKPLEEAAVAVCWQLLMRFQWCFSVGERAGSILCRETNPRKFWFR